MMRKMLGCLILLFLCFSCIFLVHCLLSLGFFFVFLFSAVISLSMMIVNDGEGGAEWLVLYILSFSFSFVSRWR